jgi:hypothetical protein
MVNSYIYYTGDGNITEYQVTFDYLSKEFVKVYLDGDLKEIETDYIFSGDRTIVFLAVPPNGSSIFIQRVTSKDRLVEFRDASILIALDLDVSALQAIHIAEEASDNIQNVIQADPSGNFDALGRRIVNVGDPIDPTDATNKGYTDGIITTVNDAVTVTTDKAIEASGYATDALGYLNDAIVQVGVAEGYASDASQSAIDAALAAASIGILSSEGELAIGQDTIVLPWVYDPILGNVAVYLNGVKQAGDTLTFVDENTVKVGDVVTETTTWEVVSVTIAGESVLTALRDQAADARDVVLAALEDLEVNTFATLNGVETLTNKTLTGYIETVYAISGTTPALDPDNGTIQTWTLSANSNPTNSLSSGQSMTLMVADGAAYSITWPTVTWVGGSAPTLATSGYTVIVLWRVGSTLYGMKSGEVA